MIGIAVKFLKVFCSGFAGGFVIHVAFMGPF